MSKPMREPLQQPGWPRQCRCRADESAVQRSARHRISPDTARGIAHVATATTLANWGHAARRILKSRGALTLIGAPTASPRCSPRSITVSGALELLPVHGDARGPANRVLVRAIKGGRAPTQIHPALMLNDELGVPNKWVQEILAGNGSLPLASRKGRPIARVRSGPYCGSVSDCRFGVEVK